MRTWVGDFNGDMQEEGPTGESGFSVTAKKSRILSDGNTTATALAGLPPFRSGGQKGVDGGAPAEMARVRKPLLAFARHCAASTRTRQT